MESIDWVLVAPIVTAIAALAASLGQFIWGQKAIEANNEVIRAKDAEIETLTARIQHLQEFTSPKVKEHFINTKELLEDYNQKLHGELENTKVSLAEKNEELAQLRNTHNSSQSEIKQLVDARSELEDRVLELSDTLQEIQQGSLAWRLRSRRFTARQQQIMEFIENYIHEHGTPPSFWQIVKGLDFSSSSVVEFNLKRLQAEGLLESTIGEGPTLFFPTPDSFENDTSTFSE